MEPHLIRYRLKPEHAARNDELLGAVFDELVRVKPAGLRYAAYKLSDGVSYVHLVALEPQAGEAHLMSQIAALKDFHAGIRERCDEAPTRETLTVVGQHGFSDPAP